MSITPPTGEQSRSDEEASRSGFTVEPTATADEAALLPPKLQARLAAWYRLSGQFGRAEALLDEMTGRGPSAALLDERMALALARRDADAVHALADERLTQHPAPSAKATYARALLELGEVDEAAGLVEALLAAAPDLQTVQAVAAEVALQVGDPSDAYDRCQRELAADPSRVAPRLLEARIALLSGDPETARRSLDLALAGNDLTANQLGTAAGLADLLGQPGRSQALRLQAARYEAARASALAGEIDAVLGRDGAEGAGEERPVPTLRANEAASGSAVVTPPSSSTRAARPEVPRRVAEEGATSGEPELAEVVADETLADPRVIPALRDLWGFDALRPGQSAVINRAMAGRDTLAVMPTGAGKSLTFQLPAMLLDGPTLVISPLIALMKDQVEAMPPAVRERTAVLNSSLAPDEQRRLLDGIATGDYAMVYAAPERLRQHAFVRALRAGGVARVVVDEAHCISLWGHDFRPDYLSIPAVLPSLGEPPVLAITATATREMERGIADRFGRDLELVRSSMFRPNLRYEVETVADRPAKIDRIVALCREEPGSGIVYVSSRRDAETIADLLRRARVQAVAYHAGMDPGTRSRNQDAFMSGRTRIVVATVAFGMGVDKADVRLIVHAAPPGSLEAYAQESGRAGRDGQPARCVMLATTRDRAALRRVAERDALDLDDLRRVYARIRARAVGTWALLDPSSLADTAGDRDPDDAPDPRIALNLLEQGRLARRHPDAPAGWNLYPAEGKQGAGGPLWEALIAWLGLDTGGLRSFRTAEACAALDCSPLELAEAIVEAPGWNAGEDTRLPCWELLPAGADAANRMNGVMLEAKRRAERRIAAVIDYQAGTRCRHVTLARHLGERIEPCGTSCDVCDPTADGSGGAAAKDTPQRSRLSPADLLAVVRGVRSLEFPVGKKRLALFLGGSRESRIDPDASPLFGALADLRRARIEEAIDRLLAAGLLAIDPDDDYKVIRAIADARSLDLDDLAPLLPGAGSAANDGSSALLDRLTAWRRDRAANDGVPAYTVAHNSTLEEIAGSRPQDETALAAIKGFGAARAAKYAAELLPILGGGG